MAVNIERLRPSKRRRARRKCATEIEAFLNDHLLKIISEETSTEISQMGAKVWILPHPYYKWWRTNRSGWLALADYFSQVLGVPTMRCAASVPMSDMGSNQSSGTRRTLGKGVIGEALFGNPRSAAVLVHVDNHSDRLGSLSKREFMRLKPNIRKGMKREDFRRLSAMYGSTVAVPLSPEVSSLQGLQMVSPVGVLTVHCTPSRGWTEAECIEVARWAAAGVGDCVEVLQRWGYSIPDAADSF